MPAIEEQQRSIDAMKANLRAMKMNRGRINIDRKLNAITAAQKRRELVKDQVGRFLAGLCLACMWGIWEERRKVEAELVRLTEVRQGVGRFLEGLANLPVRRRELNISRFRNEFGGLEMDRNRKKFMDWLERQHPRLHREYKQSRLDRLEKETISAAVRYARHVAGEIIKAADVNEGERLTGEQSLDTLEMQVRRQHKFSPTEFRSDRRHADLVKARQEFMWLASKYTSHSLPDIGRYLGGMDHSTILHGIKKHEQRLREAT